jgi:hypothetical protein
VRLRWLLHSRFAVANLAAASSVVSLAAASSVLSLAAGSSVANLTAATATPPVDSHSSTKQRLLKFVPVVHGRRDESQAELEAIESDCNCAGCCADELVTARVASAADARDVQARHHRKFELFLIGLLLLSILSGIVMFSVAD